MKDAQDNYINLSLEERIRLLLKDGYSIRIHKFKSKGKLYFYVKAIKNVDGKRKETTVARVSPEEAERLKELGLVGNRKKLNRKSYKKKQKTPSNNTTTSAQPKVNNGLNFFDHVGGVEPTQGKEVSDHNKYKVGFHNLSLTLNRSIEAKDLVGKGFSYNERSKQYMKSYEVMGRRVTVFVSKNGNVSINVRASENPIGKEEINAFVSGLLGLLSSVFGKRIDAREVTVKNFEFNVDENCDYELPARRLEVSVHMPEKNKMRREIRYSGDIPLTVFMNGGFTNEYFKLNNINAVKNILSEATDTLYSFSGATYVDSVNMICKDVVEALDEEQVHNLMLHVNKSPQRIPKDYVLHKKVNGVWVKKIALPVKNLLMRIVEIWASRRSVTIYVKASGCPMGYDDFMKVLGVIEHELYNLYGETISHDDIRVLRVEFNVDNPVMISAQDYVVTVRDIEEEYRRYIKVLPDGNMVERIERVEHKKRSLTDFVEEMKLRRDVGRTLIDIKKTLEEVKGSMTSRQLEVGAVVEAVANRIANVIWAMFEKHDANLERVLKQSLKDLLNKVEEWVKDYVEQKVSELGNVMTNGNGNSRREYPWDKTINDVPRGLVKFLSELDKAGYIRIMYEKVMYGDKLWAAIRYYKGNIDAFIEEASYEFLDAKADLRKLFKSVIKAIRFYDNKYGDITGVPWSKFLEALEMFYGKSIGEIEIELRKCGYYKPQM